MPPGPPLSALGECIDVVTGRFGWLSLSPCRLGDGETDGFRIDDVLRTLLLESWVGSERRLALEGCLRSDENRAELWLILELVR